MPDRRKMTTAGLVLVRQKPGSAKGVMFITIEDETGVANLVIWPSLYEKQRQIILAANMLGVEGRVQREGQVVHIVADKLIDNCVRIFGHKPSIVRNSPCITRNPGFWEAVATSGWRTPAAASVSPASSAAIAAAEDG